MPHGRTLTWQPLLFRQVCLLAAVAGMLCVRYPLHGVVAWLALPGFSHTLSAPEPAARLSPRRGNTLALFLLCAVVGFVFAWVRTPKPLETLVVPAWVQEAAAPDEKDAPTTFSSGVPVSGTIRENTPQAGNRIRLLLSAVRPAHGAGEALPGLLVLSWRNPPPDLANAGPGQRLRATLQLRAIRGFANPGVWETESYWQDRNAYYRAWSRDDGSRGEKFAPYQLEGEAPTWWRTRVFLRNAVIAAITEPSGAAASENSAPGPKVSQSAAFIPALLFGDRSFCSRETLDLVAKSTLAHSLALSGMHLGYAAALGYFAAYLLSFLFPTLFLHLPRQKAGLLLAFPVCLAYLWLGGAPPSLVRAALMLLFWGILLWRYKPKVLLDGLIWAVAVILLVSPGALYDIRLQLSAVSVAGIALAMPLIDCLPRPGRGPASLLDKNSPLKRRLLRILFPLAGMAVISVAAQTAVLPLVVDAFPGTGAWFPLNLLWLPVLGIWVMPMAFAGLLGVILDLPSLASGFFFLAELPCSGLLFLLRQMDAIGILSAPVLPRPAWPAMAGYWLLLLLIPMALTARAVTSKLLGTLALGLTLLVAPSLWAAFAAREDMVALQLLDVGQGQSVLISWQGKRGSGRALIDGGGFVSDSFDVGRQVITPALTDNKLPRLDWLINTHPDADHLQGLLFPLAEFQLANVAFGPAEPAKRTQTMERRDAILEQRNITPAVIRAGDAISLAPGLVLEVLHPGEDAEKMSANNAALVLRLVANGKPLALICGDLESEGLRSLLKRQVPLEAEVLILPHHGSAGSHSPALYDAVKPKLALAACGYANQWRFPAATIRDSLKQRGIPLETTADRGQIAVTWKENAPMRTTFARK